MAKKFLTGLNLVVLDTDPATGSEGELYFNSSASVAKIYQAGAWSVLGAGGGGTTVSTTEPSSPEIGDSWYKNDTGEFYVYDGTYWVEVNGVISLTQEEVQDYVSPLFVHNNHTNITATYDDINNKVLLEGVSAVSGSLSNIDSISSPDFIQFDTTANIAPVTGLLGWDSVEGTLNLGLSSTKHIHLGEESVYRVRNSTGSAISKGTALYASGVESSGRIQVTPYVADGSVREVRFMGLATESISNGINGFVQHFGYVRDLDTRGTSSTAISVGDETWGAGDILYVHPTVPGKLTNVKPTHAVVVAIIIIRHQTTGILFVRPSSGGHLEDIHDILISGSVQNNEILSYDLSNGLWINKTAGEAGLSISSHNHTLDSLSNVSASASLDNQTLKYDITSGTWENKFIDSVEFLGYNSGSASIPAFRAVRSINNFDGQYPEIINIDLQSIAAIGITSASVAGNSFGKVVTFGILNNVDTSEFIDGDILYVSDTNGSLATTRPTSGNVQIIARVIKGESVDGIVHVFNSSQEFNLPNLTQNKIWMGDAANYPSEQDLSTTIISEGSNLYFTNQRAIDATISTISSASTSAVTYTNSQINLLTTTDIEEGNNLYFTNQRAVAAGSATYLTQTSASTTYQQKTPNLTELSLISGSSGFLKTDGFENWSIDSNTYSSTSHNHTLDSLTNVVITGTPSDGQAIVWDTSTSKWVNETIASGSSYPDQTGNNGKFLQTNGASVSWQNVDLSSKQNYSVVLDTLGSSYVSLGEGSGFLKYTRGFLGSSPTWSLDTATYLTSYTETSTLEDVTDRGATSSNAITISNTTEATNATTGALIVSGGVGVAKDLWIDGNLHVAGTTTTENTKTVATHDNLIYLNAALDSTITNAVYSSGSIIYTADNLYVAEMDIRITGVSPSAFNISSGDLLTVASATPTQFVVIKSDPGASYISGGTAHAKEEANPDLGFSGGYYDAGYAHAGLFRDASDGVFKFFQGYTPEPDEAVNIDTTHASFAFADIQIRNIKPQGSGQNDNFGIGYNATFNATGFANFGIGQNAFSGGSGTNNFAIGDNSLENNTGGRNFAFGNSALTNNTGDYNYAIGKDSLQNNSGWDNYSIGPALYGNTGDWNYAVGTNSLQSNTGDYNFAFGYQAGLNNTGSYNVYIGKSDGLSTSNNIVIADNEGNIRAQYLSASSGWTLGNIVSGTWNGSTIEYQYGGTGLTSLGTAGQVLTVNAGATAIEWATPSGGGGGPSTTTTSITVNTAVAIESFAIATSRTAEAIIQITQGTDYYSSKILLIHDGTNVKITEYAILESTVGAIPVTISSAISGSNVELRATITDAATTSATAKVVMTEVAV
jgi:hypothetical protein